ncbi:MAG: putative major facilitator superfamily oxalate/formate antiporter [Gemmatimonadetes bacterium]|nr:putative major facilitator superfamily oxalate/formate antiporter [Gemmatimonadota bacterium]
MALLSFLDREHSIAPAQYSRWLVPPAALAIHLSIGQAYAFSVFNLPLSKVIGGAAASPDDWKLSTLGWIFSIAIVFLGLSAAIWGAWLERVGPRKAMFVSACCFGGGFLIGALGISTHQLWLLLLGYGVLGGIGLGLGYISPVSTLIKWFPDRPGMATGLAIMGFGGGAMVASPLSVALMSHFRDSRTHGLTETFVTMGIGYFLFMMIGVFLVRLPAASAAPAGSAAGRPLAHTTEQRSASATSTAASRQASLRQVPVNEAWRTPQFWLLWLALFCNVTAGIGVLGQASAMIQEVFTGRITAAAAAGFVGLLSLCNMAGRFIWSTTSDKIGRKPTYMIFFALGALLYFAVPTIGVRNVGVFVALYAVILSMYGGGFATIPAYLRDLFGTVQVGAIHGRILTAWSAAGLAGPILVNYIREYQISHGVAKAASYNTTMYIMASLLIVGFIANALVRPLPVGSAQRAGTPVAA